MAECVLMKSGVGADLDAVTAAAADVVAPKVIVGQDGEPVTGTIVDRGNWNSTELAAGASVTIPAGRHGGGGKVTAKSLAAQTGGATATDQYVKSGMTYWKDGVKRTGTMIVSSVVSFSVAAYSTSQVLCTWKNPAKGPYSGVLICAKAGGYPNNAWDGITYQGVGSNSALNGTSTVIMSGLIAGTTYYFRIWVYCTCSSETLYSGYLQTTCAPTAHGRLAFTSSGTFIVPTNVRSINIHCTGGGGAGISSKKGDSNYDVYGGGGGGGGYTSYRNGISVSPGQAIIVTVGGGGVAKVANDISGAAGGQSSASLNGSILVSAAGGKEKTQGSSYSGIWGSDGGSGGGAGSHLYAYSSDRYSGGTGGSDGSAGTSPTPSGYEGKGQGSSTREFGTGTLYAGGGGGGGARAYNGSSETYPTTSPGPGGSGGGGAGGAAGAVGNPGTAGTGGGGGGGGYNYAKMGGNGGSGNAIITW